MSLFQCRYSLKAAELVSVSACLAPEAGATTEEEDGEDYQVEHRNPDQPAPFCKFKMTALRCVDVESEEYVA